MTKKWSKIDHVIPKKNQKKVLNHPNMEFYKSDFTNITFKASLFQRVATIRGNK